MVEIKTPKQAAPEPEGQRQRFGPGLLLFFGLLCLLMAAWCFYDLFLSSAGSSWEAKGSTGTIWLNRVALPLCAIGAVYFFVLAAVRSKKPPSGDASGEV